MSTNTSEKRERQGSLKLVNPATIQRWGAFYVAETGLLAISKWWFSILLGSFLNPFFYLTSLGIGVGTLINARMGNVGVDGVSYIKFLAPALLAQVAMNDFVMECTFPVLNGFKWDKRYFAMNSTTLSGGQIALGTYLAAFVKTSITTTIYYLVLSSFGAINFIKDFLILPAVIFPAACFAAVMLGATATPENDDLFLNIMSRMLMMPLFLFSGTFYPLHTLPTFLQYLGYASPLWHSVELGRWIAYGHSINGSILIIHFAYLAILLVAGLTYARHRFNYRLAK